jgi:carboxy-cis,cis-muconate cyclase
MPAFGPHQYLAKNERGDRVYTTSWAVPPTLSSWTVERADDDRLWIVEHINSVPISAYIVPFDCMIPPPYTHLYSAGGPTGEVHVVDPSSGGFGEKIQKIQFVPTNELENADKSRVALVSTINSLPLIS